MRRNHRLHRAGVLGFTLIELAFVMVIIGLLSSIAIPRVSNVMGINLRTSAIQVSGYLGAAYEQAVMRHQRLRVRFDFEKGTFWAEQFTPLEIIPLMNSETKILDVISQFEDMVSQDKISEEDRLAQLQEQYRKVEIGSLTAKSLPQGIRFRSIYMVGQSQMVQEGTPSIEFTPTGFAQQAIVYVENDNQDIYSIVLYPLAGRSRIEKGEIRPDEI